MSMQKINVPGLGRLPTFCHAVVAGDTIYVSGTLGTKGESLELVAGGTGLIGRPLVEMLLERGADVRVSSLDDASRAHPKTDFRQVNLLSFQRHPPS